MTERSGFEVEVSIHVAPQDIDDILVGAFEGGINYWCSRVEVKDDDFRGGEFASDVISRGGILLLHVQDDDDSPLTLDLERFAKGFKLWLESRSRMDRAFFRFSEHGVDTANIDADDADMIVQYAVFGEIRYS